MWVRIDPDAAGQANIIASHSLNREAMLAHVRLYRTIMDGDSPLTRAEREAIAVTVSAANNCHY